MKLNLISGKKKRKTQVNNLLHAYKNAVKNNHLTESQAEKMRSEMLQDFKKEGK